MSGPPFDQDGGREPTAQQATAAAWAIAPGLYLAGIGGGIVFPILPIVGIRLHLSLVFIGLILAANRFTRVLTNPFVGGLVDRLGGKRLLVWGLFGEAVIMGLYWYALKSPFPGPLFLIARLLWGPASSGIFVGGQTLALNAGGREHRGMTAGIARAAQSLGTPSGMVFGGLVAGFWGDGTAFLVGAAAATVAALVSRQKVPHLMGDPGTSEPHRWREVLSSLKDRRVDALAFLNFASFFSVQGLLLATMVLLIHSRRLAWLGLPTEALAGTFLATLLATGALTTALSGRWADRSRGRASVSTIGLFLMVPGFVMLAFLSQVTSLLAALGLIGIGMGILSVPLLALLGDLVPRSERGRAVGSFQLFGDAGGSLGPIAGTALLSAWGSTAPYLATAALLALTIPVGLWLTAAEHRTVPRSA